MLMVRSKDGNSNAHQALGSSRTVASSLPQLATSGGRPIPKNDKVLSQLKEKGLKEIVWTHTMEVFQKVREEGGKY